MEKWELVIIGAGPAVRVYIYGRRAGLDVLLSENIRRTDHMHEIENWRNDTPSGSCSKTFRNHAEHFKTEFRTVQLGIEILAEARSS